MKIMEFAEEQGSDRDFEFDDEAPTIPCGPPALSEDVRDETPTLRTRALLIEALP